MTGFMDGHWVVDVAGLDEADAKTLARMAGGLESAKLVSVIDPSQYYTVFYGQPLVEKLRVALLEALRSDTLSSESREILEASFEDLGMWLGVE